MPPLIARESIRRRIGEESQKLIRGTCTSDGSTTTVVDSSLYSSVQDQRVRARAVVALTGGHTDRGQRRWATGPPSTAGVITVSPAFTTGGEQDETYEIWDADFLHPDDIDLAIDRALQRSCWFWRAVPLSMYYTDPEALEDNPTGSNNLELKGTSTVIWNANSASVALNEWGYTPDEPDRLAITVQALASPGYLESNSIPVDPDRRSRWRMCGLLYKPNSNAQVVSIIPYDNTNGADIDTDETNSIATGEGPFIRFIETGFTLPSGCYDLTFRLHVDTNGQTGNFGWLSFWEEGQTTFHLPPNVQSKRHVGPVFRRVGDDYREFKRLPWQGQLQRREAVGRGVALELSPAPGARDLWYYHKTSFPALTSSTPAAADDDNATWAAEEWVVWASLVEVYEALRRRDREEYPTRWLEDLDEARMKLQALQADYGIEPMLTDDSSKPRGRAILRV